MAPIFAQVGRDAISARFLRDLGSTQRIGLGPPTRVAHGRHMVDVHTQSQFVGHGRRSFRFVCKLGPGAGEPNPSTQNLIKFQDVGSEGPSAGSPRLAAALAFIISNLALIRPFRRF